MASFTVQLPARLVRPARATLSGSSRVSVKAPAGARRTGARVTTHLKGTRRGEQVVRCAVIAPTGVSGDDVPEVKVQNNPLAREGTAPVIDENSTEPVRLRIDGQWYDCRGWAKAHPGGERWIHFFDGRDATDAFYALHSYGPNGADKAIKRLEKLPKCDAPQDTSRLPNEEQYAVSMEFQDLRKKLEEDGFFKRNYFKEAWAFFQVAGLYIAGTAVAYTNPFIATVLIGLGMVQAGWLGHDYVHGRGKLCDTFRYMPTLLNGHGVHWWTQKHSMHHTFTNEEHLDNDVMMEPFFFLRHPSESGRPDAPSRKFQHIYGYPLLSIMFWLWRFHSAQCAWERKDKRELACMAINYSWLIFCMPPAVAIGSVFLSGFIVGSLVSATHQSEEIMEYGEGDEYVLGQFRSTRDAECVFGPLETWIWGGMDTQLEHHLFPTMPRYNYHKLRPILKAWAKANGVGYRSSPSTKIIADNFNQLKRIASMP